MLWLLFACTAETDSPAPDTGAADDTGAPSDTADTLEDTAALLPEDITATVSEEVHTVVTVRWTTAEATQGYVEFGEDDSYGRTTPIVASGTEHEVLLLGLWADTEFHFRVVTVAEDGSEVASADHTVTTGTLPADLPTLTVTGEVRSWVGEYMVLPIQGTTYAVTVVDDHGRYVWYDVLEPEHNLMRAMVSADRTSLLYCLAGHHDTLDAGEIERVSLDGYTREEFSFPYVDHDFTELPDGTWAAIVVTANPDGQGNADSIVEMNPDGTGARTVWSAWDDPVLAPFADPFSANWTHGNALDYDPVEDVYYLSMKDLGTIVKVDRATGQSLWHLNGRANTFAFPDGTDIVQMQHQFQVLDGGILVFDNGPLERGWSQAVELTLDEEGRTAEQVWSYARDPAVGVYAKGDVERFADGNTQVTWSTLGEIQDVDPDGNVHWQLNTELGYAITFVQHVPSLY